jgi:hypothetical protein
MFWSKSPHTHKEHLAENKKRDIKVRAHHLHMEMAAAQTEEANKSTAHAETPDASAGLDEDFRSKIGREKQQVKEIAHGTARQLRGMRSRVRRGRRKNSSRGRSLGF